MLANFTSEQINELGALLNSFGNEFVSRDSKSNPAYVESRYFKITEQVDTDGETEFKATEVTPDGKDVSIPIVFDSDATPSDDIGTPIYLSNLKFNDALFSGSVEVGKAYQVEEVEATVFGDPPDWYVIPKGGAVESTFRLEVKADNTVDKGSFMTCDLIDIEGVVIEADVYAYQFKYDSANFYEGEVLYAIQSAINSSGATGYLLDPFLVGVGGTSNA